MRRYSFGMSATAIALTLLAAAGCSQPPAEAIDLAAKAEAEALIQGVEQYAADAMGPVVTAKAELEAELAAQEERWTVTRSYDRAEELALAYKTAADQAASAAMEGRMQAQAEAQSLIQQTRLALEEVGGMLAVAPVGKGSRADLAAFRMDLDAAGTALGEADAALAAESFLEAKSRAGGAHESIERVRAALTQAATGRSGNAG